MSALAVTFADVAAAHQRIAPYVHRTPVFTSRLIDAKVGARVAFKCEIFQRVGAFKARGAFNRLLQLSVEERARGVVAFSSGNHAQAVALAARELAVTATIIMPADAPASKIAATRSYGARVLLYDRLGGASRESLARQVADDRGAILVPPFDDPAIIAGQGTAARELLAEVPDLDILLTPCGGGGLLSGSAVAGRYLRPGLRLWGVEPETGDDMKRSLEQGEPVTIPLPSTIADCIQTTRPGDLTFPIVRDLTEGILTVSDDELRRAMALLASRMKIVVEPGATAGFAALLAGKVPESEGRKIGVILSGGNVDPERFGELIARVESEPQADRPR
jgi:threonine dehydratase